MTTRRAHSDPVAELADRIRDLEAGVARLVAVGHTHRYDVPWTALTLTSPWVASSGLAAPAYRVVGDEVQLRGFVDGSALNSTIATLAALAPPAALKLSTSGSAGSNLIHTVVEVEADGDIIPRVGGWLAVSLAPIRWSRTA